MRSEWKEFRLGDITEWASGGTPSKQNADFWNGTIPWISASSMGSNRYNESYLKITQEGLKAGSRLAKKDSILLLVRGSTLHQRIPVGIATSDVSFNQDVKAIRAKEEFIDPWYLLFWFMAKEKDLLNMVENTGIGAGKLDTNRLQNLLIRIPPDSERNKILLFVKALDDKLLLNCQINQTLESIAQAIFKSWFIDFEPVKAKIAAIEAGEDAEGVTRAAMSTISGKTNEELDQMQAEQPENYIKLKITVELFPDAMQDSELGDIPEGWKPSSVGSEFDVIMGQSPPGDTYNEDGKGEPFFQGRRDFGWRYPENRVYCTQPNRIAKKGDTLLSVRAPVGDINKATSDCCIGRGIAALRHKSGCEAYTYYSIMNLSRNFKSFDSEGTVFGSINQKDLKALKVLKPPSSIVEVFTHAAGIMDQHILNFDIQTRILSQLRDTLLPKLLSGELSVDTAEFVEEN